MEFEELVDVALSFLEEELLVERGLVIHADPGERDPIVQGHTGFTAQGLAEIETIRWQWMSSEEPFLVEWQRGRSLVGCPLPGVGGGLIYADHSCARFQQVHLDALEEFAVRYAEALRELVLAPAPPELVNAFPNLAPSEEADLPIPRHLLLVDWL